MGKRIKIEDVDLEKDLSPFNGHIPFDFRDMSEHLEEAESKLEHLLLHGSGEQLVFAEDGGSIYFGIGSNGYHGLLRYGKVPAEVQAKGTKAIRAHASARMKAALAKYHAWRQRCAEYGEHPDVLVEVQHGEVKLSGRIISADHRYFTLRIEKPFIETVENVGGYNQWSSMAGREMFDHDEYVESDPHEMCLSEDAINLAKEELIARYRQRIHAKKNAKTIGVVDRLNRKG